jgi:hypothetical protein
VSITIFDAALLYLNTLGQFIENDMTSAINSDACYLAALGLSSYTEILGELYSGGRR